MRRCDECGDTIVGGDPAIRALGHLFCSEECADDFEQYGPRDDVYDVPEVSEGCDVYGSL